MRKLLSIITVLIFIFIFAIPVYAAPNSTSASWSVNADGITVPLPGYNYYVIGSYAGSESEYAGQFMIFWSSSEPIYRDLNYCITNAAGNTVFCYLPDLATCVEFLYNGYQYTENFVINKPQLYSGSSLIRYRQCNPVYTNTPVYSDPSCNTVYTAETYPDSYPDGVGNGSGSGGSASSGWLSKIFDKIVEFFESVSNGFKSVIDWFGSFFTTLGNWLKDLFIPSDGYFDSKIADLKSHFEGFETIKQIGDRFSTFFSSDYNDPPIITTNMSDAESKKYNYGSGTVKVIDLSWYGRYKPTVDKIISAILWLCFAWGIYQHLPGIINGASGVYTGYYTSVEKREIRERRERK